MFCSVVKHSESCSCSLLHFFRALAASFVLYNNQSTVHAVLFVKKVITYTLAACIVGDPLNGISLYFLTFGYFFFFFVSECAPSASFHVLLYDDQIDYSDGLLGSGFVCNECRIIVRPHFRCTNCSFCMSGTYSNLDASCLNCPAGNLRSSPIY